LKLFASGDQVDNPRTNIVRQKYFMGGQ